MFKTPIYRVFCRRFLLSVLVLFLGISCVSLQNNYLGPMTNFGQDSIPSRILSINEKIIKQKQIDSLLKNISERKRFKRHLTAQEINQLYTGFGEQLNNDRFYQYELQKHKLIYDSLNEEQYQAALELLSSAAYYEESYQKNKVARRTLNRGDSGNNIPSQVLQKSRNFLFAPSIRDILKKQRTNFQIQQQTVYSNCFLKQIYVRHFSTIYFTIATIFVISYIKQLMREVIFLVILSDY